MGLVNELLQIPEIWNPLHSDLIDEDIKKQFKNKSAFNSDIVQMQLIKTMRELIVALEKLPEFQFDAHGNLYVREKK